jgi:hypothetical protein
VLGLDRQVLLHQGGMFGLGRFLHRGGVLYLRRMRFGVRHIGIRNCKGVAPCQHREI